jgi:hypothetical protein
MIRWLIFMTFLLSIGVNNQDKLLEIVKFIIQELF